MPKPPSSFYFTGQFLSLRRKSNIVESKALSELLDKFKGLRVLIIGDVMVDSYIWGSVTRISPEAPVPVVMQTGTEARLGGAANVALNVKSLGAVPVMCSVIGKDANSILFKELIRKLDMPEEALIESPERVTTCKTRIIAGHQQLLRVDQEVDHYISGALESALIQRIKTLIGRGDIAAIVFQDYDKGVITPKLIDEITKEAAMHHIPTLVDPKKRNFAHYHHVSLFKPNFKELCEGMNLELKKSDLQKIHEAAQLMKQKSDFEMVMITLSEQGLLISADGKYHVIPAQAREVSDVSGAGDTVIATASLCLAVGLDPYQMAELSNLAAGLVIERIGVVPVEKEWLLDAVR